MSENSNNAVYLNPVDADTALKQLFNSTGEEERHRKSHCTVERHRHEYTAGWDGISQEDIDGECDKENELAGTEKWSHVETSQVGALHDLGDLFSRRTQNTNNEMWPMLLIP